MKIINGTHYITKFFNKRRLDYRVPAIAEVYLGLYDLFIFSGLFIFLILANRLNQYKY
jgi:hypothetical protein